MINLILQFAAILFVCFTYYVITAAAVKKGLVSFASEVIPLYAQALTKVHEAASVQGQQVPEMIEPQESDALTDEQSVAILRNMRGEK